AVFEDLDLDALEHDHAHQLLVEPTDRVDLVVGAVHATFDLPRARQTARILRAMDHPPFSILAHPNGRLFGTRGPCELDMDRMVQHAHERGWCLALNAHPD